MGHQVSPHLLKSRLEITLSVSVTYQYLIFHFTIGVPSVSPSLLPSSMPSINPSSVPSSIPSLTQFPSSEPSNTRNPSQCIVQNSINANEGYDASQKTCKMDMNLDVQVNTDKKFLTALGSYGTSNGEHDGSFDQDYEGGAFISESSNLLMIGNAWKAFKLDNAYELTKNTRISFDFEIFREAQGHAICFDNDLNEDTFGGSQIRCLMLAGKQFSKWNHVKKLDLAQEKKGVATQSSTQNDAGCEASNAVDGVLRQKFVTTAPSLNSIACTDPQINPWWQFHFDETVSISEVIIHMGRDFPGSQNTMSNFRVTICDSTTANQPYLSPNSNDCEPNFNQVGELIIHENAIGQDGIASIQVNRAGRVVRITLQGNEKKTLGLAEVQILGTIDTGKLTPIDVNLFDIMPTQDALIRYVSFIQDDDEFPQKGDIPLHEGAVMSQ